jgi:hypothetical protein
MTNPPPEEIDHDDDVEIENDEGTRASASPHHLRRCCAS